MYNTPRTFLDIRMLLVRREYGVWRRKGFHCLTTFPFFLLHCDRSAKVITARGAKYLSSYLPSLVVFVLCLQPLVLPLLSLLSLPLR